MPRALWPHVNGRPVVSINLILSSGQGISRVLLADTGAGRSHVGFDLLLQENDCLACGGIPAQSVVLSGAYAGTFRVFVIRVTIPTLSYDHFLRAVAVHHVPPGMDGIAGFRFLNRFTYGNFGDLRQFGLEI